MRLFISLNLPQKAGEYLTDLQSSLPEAQYRFPADFHITLKFLGDVSEDKYGGVVSVLRKTVFDLSETESLQVVLSKLGVFQDRNVIRSVFVRVELPEVLLTLQQQIDRAFGQFGFKSEHSFILHVTLARMKSYNKTTFLTELKKIKTEQASFSVNAVFLMESFLSENGSRYEVREKFSLK